MQKNIIVGRNLLETITSALYENPIILFREYVQNSLDAYNDATKLDGKQKIDDFKVQIDIDKEHKTIVITDNGYGIDSTQIFEKEMLSFGDSSKTDRSQFIGFRGIGRISALPFCETLIFKDKRVGSDTIDICVWEGAKYRDLLNSDAQDGDSFEKIVKSIVEIKSEPCDNDDTHYFKVEIIKYTFEIEEVMGNFNFEQSLRKLLPIKYSDIFLAGKIIEEKYRSFMNEELSDFMCSVFYNDTELRKNYTDENHLLESNLVFWEVREKSGANSKPGDKIGLLWFTFNKKMTAAKDNDYGIMIRSKNVLMGDNDTFANLCTNSKEHVATYSELTATLRGVYGEFLINSPNLKDNARREWFKTDEYSIYLKYVIVDFMKRLYKYRYAASSFFRLRSDEKAEEKRSKLKVALVELIDVETNKLDVSDFCKSESQESEEKPDPEDTNLFSDEDIPRQTQTKRKNYDELMKVIEEFFEKEKLYDVFIKLRAYIKRYFNS